MKSWTPGSWRHCPIEQQPVYADLEGLNVALEAIRSYPPIVHQREIDSLKKRLASAVDGKCFLLQKGGDCAERFEDLRSASIENRLRVLLHMSLILVLKAQVRVVNVARMAGQFAKPRSNQMESVNNQIVWSYKGDMVNSRSLSREPDPSRLVASYFHSVATLNYLRTLVPESIGRLYEHEYATIRDRLGECWGISGGEVCEGGLGNFLGVNREISGQKVNFYISHEGLLLGYEESLTKYLSSGYYNVGTHFLWIGDRTRRLGYAHVEYFKGIENPIGLKVGPTLDPAELVELVRTLNPRREKGKLTLITRYGVSRVEECLPLHISAVKETQVPVLWCCDPCHGNTEMTFDGVKTRSFDKIVGELVACFRIHYESGSFLGGVHLEVSGEDVTECIGGIGEKSVTNLNIRYETFCDPRLNYTQAIGIALRVSEELNRYAGMREKAIEKFDAEQGLSHSIESV